MDITRITIHWEDSEEKTSHFVRTEHVERFVEATKQLHVSPAVNPHSGNPCRKAKAIIAEDPEIVGPYWWTTPGLQENGDPNGAEILSFYKNLRILWGSLN